MSKVSLLANLFEKPVHYAVRVFSSPVRKYRKSYCTTPGTGGGVGVNENVQVLCQSFKDLIFSKSSDGFSLYLV